MRKTYFTNSSSQTKKMAEVLARKILKLGDKKTAVVIGLEGDFGAGKTTFLQGFAKGLEIRERILSPTFVIMRKFQIPTKTYNLKPKTFVHIDCYRIERPKEILDLGFKKNILNPQNIIAVEWADRIKKIMPQKTLWIKFEFINKNKRKILIKNG